MSSSINYSEYNDPDLMKKYTESLKKDVDSAKIEPKEPPLRNEKLLEQMNDPGLFEKKQGGFNELTVIAVLNDNESTNYDISNFVLKFQIVKNFEEDFKPIYKIELSLPQFYYTILSKYVSTTFHVKLKSSKSILMDVDEQLTPLGNILEMEDVLDVKLKMYTFSSKSDQSENIETNENNIIGDGSESKVIFSMECFDLNHINSGVSLYSFNYRNQNMKDIIIDVINKNKDICLPNINKLVFCPPDTSLPIDNMTIPPMNMVSVLREMQDKFNIYKRHAIFFVDTDTLYICKRGYTPYMNNDEENRIFIVFGKKIGIAEERTKEIVSMIDKEKVCYISDEYEIDNNYTAAMEKFGSAVIIKSDADTVGDRSICIGLKDDSSLFQSIINSGTYLDMSYKGKEKFINDNTNAKLRLNLLLDAAQADSFDVWFKVKYFNLSKFKPITDVYVKFVDKSDKEYDGSYYIRQFIAVYEYVGQDRNLLDSVAMIRLGRKYDDNGNIVK